MESICYKALIYAGKNDSGLEQECALFIQEGKGFGVLNVSLSTEDSLPPPASDPAQVRYINFFPPTKDAVEKLIARLTHELGIATVTSSFSAWNMVVLREKRVILIRCRDPHIWAIFDTHATRFPLGTRVVMGMGLRTAEFVGETHPDRNLFTPSARAVMRRLAEHWSPSKPIADSRSRRVKTAPPAVHLMGRSPDILKMAVEGMFSRKLSY